MRNYLLGNATAAENEEIGVRAIEDEWISGEFYVAENELIEDYLEGTLTDAEREAFEKHFLVSEERRDRVNEIRLLKRYSSGPHRFDLPEVEEKRSSWYGRWWLVPAYATAILCFAALAVWQFGGLNGRSPLEQQYAELNKKNFSDPGTVSGMQTVTLAPGTFRNGGTNTVVEMNGQSESIYFRLPLSFAVAADTVFSVHLVTENGRFAAGDAPLYKEGPADEVRFLAPRSILSRGINRIELNRKDSGDAPVVYTFEAR